MTQKWYFGLVIIHIWMLVFSASNEGQNALASTTLSASLSATATTATVASTTDFPTSGTLILDNEVITYTGKGAATFTGLGRAQDSTTAVAHASGARVFSHSSGLLNQLMGYNVNIISDNPNFLIASVQTAANAVLFLINAIAKILLWDFSMWSGDWMWFKAMVLWPISAATAFGTALLIFRR